MRIYTRRGDGGTTDLRSGGRVPKDAPEIELNGAVDEAQAALGLARAELAHDDALDSVLTGLERDLWILMAEVATSPERRSDLVPGVTAVSPDMVAGLEARIDEVMSGLDLGRGFVVPGGTRCSAALDLARTVVRRAERLAVSHFGVPDPSATDPSATGARAGALVCSYLNRLSDLCWALARLSEGVHVHVRDLSAGAPTSVGGAPGPVTGTAPTGTAPTDDDEGA
jgi:cob(I)alamin adenosyltransferase